MTHGPAWHNQPPRPEAPAYGDVVAAIEQNGGPITMDRFTDIALYGPNGYFTNEVTIGPHGQEFVTSPEASPVFGRVTARVYAQMWEDLGRPEEFSVFELGPGNGTWARDIMDKLERDYPEVYARLHYKLIDVSPRLIERQREMLAGRPVEWLTLEDLARIPEGSVTGVVSGNEVFDNIAAHALTLADGEPREIRVGLSDERRLTRMLGPVSPELNRPEYTDGLVEGIAMPASPQSEQLIHEVGRILGRGYTMFIDYGASRRGLLTNPTNFMTYAHRQPDPRNFEHVLNNPGMHDITMMVDFTALQRAGEQVGLETVVVTDQRNLLMHNGLIQELAALESEEEHVRASALFYEGSRLADFYVLVQRKGVTAPDNS